MTNPSSTSLVLYVEDEEDDVFFMQMAFRRLGRDHLFRTLPTGREAMNYLSGAGDYADRQRHPLPAVLLLDLNLPAVSGFEVLQWVRHQSQFRNLPVVIFSGSVRDTDRLKAADLGASAYIEKPASPMKFINFIEWLFDRWPELHKSPGAPARRPH